MLGSGNSKDIVFINCTADKAGSGFNDVGASCFKLDSGNTAGINGVLYIGCRALNAKPGNLQIQGGFINGDGSVSNIQYLGCSAINCHVGFKVAGPGHYLHACTAKNCDIGLVTDHNTPKAQFVNVSMIWNKQNTWFFTPPMRYETAFSRQ